MASEYTGKQLHDAHYQDLMREAEGGWRLKAAGEAGQSRPINRRLVWTVIGVGIVVVVLALVTMAVMGAG